MKPEYILQSDVLDILFENRNKAYGAYYIRRHYTQNLLTALAAMFALIGMLLFALEYYGEKASGYIFTIPDHPPIRPLSPIEPIELYPPPPKPPPAPKQVASQRFTTIKIVPQAEIEEPVPDRETLIDRQVALVTIAAPFLGDIVQPPVANKPTGTNTGEASEAYTAPFESAGVDEIATYPGGPKAMMRFLQTQLRHIGYENSKTLKLHIRFVVAEDGRISEFRVIQSAGENIDRQVIKALRKMPGWNPARKNGRNVAMYFVLPVTFETAE